MDGNGRWAKDRDLPRSEGHRAGTKAAKRIVTECRRIGVSYLTLYTFSKENWKRPRKEISFLFELLVRYLREELPSLKEQSIRLNIFGELDGLPMPVRQVVKKTCAETAHLDKMVVNLALNYSGRHELVNAFQKMSAQGVHPNDIDEEKIKDYLYSAGQPDPDLIIRTSGETRLSNFLLYQTAYSEFYFTPVLWPDFMEQDLHTALDYFETRERRYGRTEALP